MNTVVPPTEKIMVPIFNVVDDADSTQEKLAKAVAEVWGIKYGFMSSTVATLVQQFAKVSETKQPVSCLLSRDDPAVVSMPS